MQSIYISLGTARWTPKTESDLQDAINSGIIEETHHLDVKQALDTTKADNRELAPDLASFAVDGGTLVIGLAEDETNGTFTLAPSR